ncbi:hypothetical protein N0V82_001058 [Gnomoniopsis sp. IMI 355080]|nr:hypothetical protein N0V82_001058 [Gnomoniopsis sp. IMI 355080]
MQIKTLLVCLAVAHTTITALELSSRHRSCSDIEIPVVVSERRYILNTTIEDNWDAVSLTFNLTARNYGTPENPVPIIGQTDSPVIGNYSIGATLCGTGSTLLVLIHGIIESKLYYQPNLSGSEQYSFVDAAVAAGYSVLNYNRIGVGSSSNVDAYHDAQFQVETAVLNSLVTYGRQHINASKVALVGHSFGAYLSAQSAAILGSQIDALILTGFSGTFEYFGPFAAGAGFRVARLADPQRWGDLQAGYLTSSDLYAETFAYFASPYFEHRVAEWSYNIASEPFAVAELLTLMEADIAYENITAATMVLQGRYDGSACGGDCVGLLGTLSQNFTAAAGLYTVDDLPAGHSLFLHEVAPQAFESIFEFLKKTAT